MKALPTPYYDCDGITIYHGDCREILPYLPKVDLVLTDPPYGINIVKVGGSKPFGKVGGSKPFGKVRGGNWITPRDYIPVYGDDKPFEPQFMMNSGTHLMFFGGNYFADKLPPSSCWLVWDKQNSGNFADCELVWTNLKRAIRIFRYTWNGCIQQQPKIKEDRVHPTQKPIPLMRWCILQADKNFIQDTILDPFMGSGTTLVAAKQLGRKAIGIEIEEKYCEIAVKRLGQGVLPL